MSLILTLTALVSLPEMSGFIYLQTQALQSEERKIMLSEIFRVFILQANTFLISILFERWGLFPEILRGHTPSLG